MATIAENAAPVAAGLPGEAEVSRVELPEGGATKPNEVMPRDAFWDNIKAVCVLLVVIAHIFGGAFVGTHAGDDEFASQVGLYGGMRSMASMIYWGGFMSVVVMPVLCFTSGHLSSREISAPHRVRALLQLGLVACIQQILNAFRYLGMGVPLNVGILKLDIHWFIICLCFWRVSLPFWMMLRKPVLVTVIIGVLAVFADDSMNLRPFLNFLPFFIAGHVTTRETLNKFRRAPVQIGFFGTAALAALVPFVLPQEIVAESTQRSVNIILDTYGCLYSNFGSCVTWLAMAERVSFYLLAVPLIPAFLAVVPEKRVWGLTHAGRQSMYIYLLHIWLLVPWDILVLTTDIHGGPLIASSLLYAFSVWALLATGCARPFCKWFIEPPIDCLVQKWVLEDWTKKWPCKPAMDSQV